MDAAASFLSNPTGRIRPGERVKRGETVETGWG